MRKKLFEKIAAIGFALCILPFSAVSCAVHSDPIGMNPHYLVEGTIAENNPEEDYFDYYLIGSVGDVASTGDPTYAIGLKEAYKDTNLGTITIPSTFNDGSADRAVTAIWRDGFRGNPSTGIQLTSNIEVIDYEAFMYSGLTAVTFPYSVGLLGEGAFYACPNLGTAIFNNSDIANSSSSAVNTCDLGSAATPTHFSLLTEIPAFCFFKCAQLTTLELPSKIETIGHEAFNGCVKLSSALAFQKLVTIESRAFQGCSSLTKVYIPSHFFSNSGSIEKLAFNFCGSDLHFYFAAPSESAYNSWLADEANLYWNCRDEITGSVYGSDHYELMSGGSYYTEDWAYEDVNGYVKITAYRGTTDGVNFISIPSALPVGSGSLVREISVNAFPAAIKSSLKRLYLPWTLRRIENSMFNGFTYLEVIAGSADCEVDLEAASIETKIDLSSVTSLEFIGQQAFCNMPKVQDIGMLHLPAGLKIIGNEAFGVHGNGGKHLTNVTDFQWDYDEGQAQLEYIGYAAFCNMGNLARNNGNPQFAPRYTTAGVKRYDVSTIIFPATFRGSAMTESEIKSYGLPFSNKGCHHFYGCPLIEKAIFKGSSDSSKTVDMALPIQFFAFNYCLRTVVFEERNGHTIAFHTENGAWREPSIGYTCGGTQNNDFRCEPGLQTLVLPNVSTNLVIQDLSFIGNARTALYLSGTMNSNMARDTTSNLTNYSKCQYGAGSIENAICWRTVGDEEYNKSRYLGYCFAPSNSTQYASYKPSFQIEQDYPYYENVHYYEQIDLNGDGSFETTVEVGESNSNHFITSGKFAFICRESDHKAVMSKYLYDRWEDETFDGTAEVPSSVTYGGASYDVYKIGDSAFTACYSDSGSNKDQVFTAANHNELTRVRLPSTLTEIGDYAFARAYGITEITAGENGTYTMPSSLRKIGKYAFMFTKLTKVLNIPSSCIFYETDSAYSTYDVCSCFLNSFELRQVTFAEGSPYMATTYTSATNSEVRTSAIYSKNTPHNDNRLLLVLNRDWNDRQKASAEYHDATDSTLFAIHADYSANPFLMGAFSMGHWISSLDPGNATEDADGNKIEQALFCGICNKRNSEKTSTTAIVYMGKANTFFESNWFDLSSVITTNLAGISPYAFDGCTNLSTIKLPAVEGFTLTDGAFMNLTTEITYATPDYSTGDWHATYGTLDLTDTGYVGIGTNTFNGNPSINTIIAPTNSDGSTFTFGPYSFANCANLTTLDLRNLKGTIVLDEGCFSGSTIQTIYWPTDGNTVIRIGDKAFENCDSLASFTLPNNCPSLGKYAFEGCDSLASIDLSAASGSFTIDDYCFQNSAISSITWPNVDDVTSISIDPYAFENCDSLVNFVLHPKCTKLSQYAFEGCDALVSANLSSASGSLIIDAHCFEASTISSITWPDIEAAPTVSINDYAFYNCDSLASFVIPNKANAIGQYAFSGCDALAEVTVQGTNSLLESISQYAFYQDEALDVGFDFQNLTGLQTIDKYAFQETGSLGGTVIFPPNICRFNERCFYSSEVTNLEFQCTGTIYVMKEAFRYCNHLVEVNFSGENCQWAPVNSAQMQDAFSSCGETFLKLILPASLNIQNSGYGNSLVWENTIVIVYSRGTLATYPTINDKRFIEYAKGLYSEVRFYASTSSDLLNSSGALMSPSSTKFWTEIDGEFIELGTSDSVDSEGTVTFSSGYTLTSTGVFTAP